MTNLLLYLILIIFLTRFLQNGKDEFPIKELNYPNTFKIINRSEWGWKPLTEKNNEAVINKITIHHGGVEFTKESDPVANIINLQQWSREEKDWIDIPYHFMIDLDGNIYETRPINYPGDTNTEYDPTGHALVEVMGNYETQKLSDKQLNSLVGIIAFLSKEFKVPLSEIKTHKDYSEKTICPGKNIYKYFQDSTIVKAVQVQLEK